MEPRVSELGDASAGAEGSQLPIQWEPELDKIERLLAQRVDGHQPLVDSVPLFEASLLVIAAQLRELIQAVRPLLDHPLLRRR